MGNTIGYVYTSTRYPDGPLISASVFSNPEPNHPELSKWNLPAVVFGIKEQTAPKPAPSPKPTIGRGRRRPTYSAKLSKAPSDASEAEYTEGSHEEHKDVGSTVDIRQRKVMEYRKLLTKSVKIKAAFFNERVKVTCSRDGSAVEWYREKNGRMARVGSLPVASITHFMPRAENDCALEITAPNPLTLTFKSREERAGWEAHFSNFITFMKLIE